MYVKIEDVLVDELFYPRNELGWRDVQRYISALATGAVFPPIVVGKRDGRYVVIDGRHRYEAFKRSKKEKIAALLTKAPQERWYIEAVRLNSIHGRTLSYQEKIKAAMVLEQQGFALDEIEKVVAIQTDQLEKAIKQRGHWLHPEDIRPVVLKASIAEIATERGREWLEEEAEKIESLQETLSGRSFVELADELVILFNNDMIPDAALDSLTRLRTALQNWLSRHIKDAA